MPKAILLACYLCNLARLLFCERAEVAGWLRIGGVWVAAGCMAVEMHTGDPLFPGESDVDQLWLILKCMGSLTPAHNHMLSRNPYFTVRQPSLCSINGEVLSCVGWSHLSSY